MKVEILGDDDDCKDNTLYHKAKLAYLNQNWVEAVYFFEKIMMVNRNGSNGEAKILEKIASCHERLKNYNLAIKWSHTLMLRRPDIPNGYLRLGKILRLIGKIEEARQIYLKGISKVDKLAIGELERQLNAIKKCSSRDMGLGTVPSLSSYLPLEIIWRVAKYLAKHEIASWESLDLKVSNLIRSSSSLWWSPLWLVAEISWLFQNNNRSNQPFRKTLRCSSLKSLERLVSSKTIYSNDLEKLILEGIVFNDQTYRALDYARKARKFKFIRCRLNISSILSLFEASSTIKRDRKFIFFQCEDPFSHPQTIVSFALTLSNLDYGPTIFIQNWLKYSLYQNSFDLPNALKCRRFEDSSFGISYNSKGKLVALCDCSGSIPLASKLNLNDCRSLRHLVTKDKSFLRMSFFHLRSLHLLAPLSMNEILIWLQSVNSAQMSKNLWGLGLYNLSGIVDAKKLIDAIISSSIGGTLRLICIPALGNLSSASLAKLHNSYPKLRIVVGLTQPVRLLNQKWKVYKEVLFG